jgi:hypothetical protein
VLELQGGGLSSPWHTLPGVRFPLALLFLAFFSASACSKACGRNPSGSYSYLVLPSGHMFRVLRTGSAVNEEQQKVGTILSYAGETPELSRVEADADALAAALAPEK